MSEAPTPTHLNKVNNEQGECIIAGDLNIDGLKIYKNKKHSKSANLHRA